MKQQEIIYKTVETRELKMTMFAPDNVKPGDNLPAIVFFFGGGWYVGTPKQFFPQCEDLAKLGIVAFSANYRVQSRDDATPIDAVEDAKSAMRYLRSHASELGIDPDRIAAGGGSAGGHLATATAVLDKFSSPDDPDVSCVPNALVLFNPVYANGPDGYGYERVKDYWEDFSPLHNIKPGMPPTIVFFGTEDVHTSVSTARDFRNRMVQAGNRSELELYDGAEHGFFNRRVKTPRKKDRYYLDTFRKMALFLASLNWIDKDSAPAPAWKTFVGPLKHWETIGRLQLEFLKSHGLKPNHKLLDIGCGCLRAGVHFIEYLRPGHYVGFDADPVLVEKGRTEILGDQVEQDKRPTLIHTGEMSLSEEWNGVFDYAIAQSVLTHIPEVDARRMATLAERVLNPGGQLFATFNPSQDGDVMLSGKHPRKRRYYRSTRYPFKLLQKIGESAGLETSFVGTWGHPSNVRGNQLMIRYQKA